MNVRIGQQFWIADNGTFCNEYFSFFGNFMVELAKIYSDEGADELNFWIFRQRKEEKR